VAGLTAAHLLDRSADVTVFESEGYAGGHTNTVTIPRGPDAGLAVDTGFIVMNEKNYPLFTRLLAELGVATQPSDMTFGYHDERTGLQYAGTGLGGLFARRRQLMSPAFLRLLADIARFNSATLRALNEGRLAGLTLGAHVASLHLSPQLTEQYLYPMTAAIWSAPLEGAAEFPAEAFAHFFANHGLLTLHDAPPWRTVAGGSQTYVRALLARFRGKVRVSAPVAQVRRLPEGVSVTVAG
jgi:predicted NAD/FAD-binding protein